MALNFQPGQLARLFPGPTFSGYAGGTFGTSDGRRLPDLEQPMPPQAPNSGEPKPKFFGTGGMGWNILGALGDALQVAGGGQASFAPAMMDLREQMAKEKQFRERLEAEAQQAALQRQQREEDWRARQQYEAEHPNPTAMQQNFAAYQQMTPEQQQAFAAYQALVQPRIIGSPETGYVNAAPGAGGMPQGYDPEEWELVPGDAGSNASGGF